MQAPYNRKEAINMNNFPLKEVRLNSVDSTNSYLKRVIKENGLYCGLAVSAKCQTAGRGRLGRSWQSVRDNTLCMSIAIKNPDPKGITLLAALAAFKCLKGFCGEGAEELLIKWPNDIIYKNKKLCGILCERVGEYTVIGVGVNVNDSDFDSELSQKATSLYLITGKKTSVDALFKDMVSAFEKVLMKHGLAFTKDAKAEYESLCANLGKPVKAQGVQGVAVGIKDDGSLVVKDGDSLVSVAFGEVAVHGIY